MREVGVRRFSAYVRVVAKERTAQGPEGRKEPSQAVLLASGARTTPRMVVVLSATPHNGHSNRFSSLLELLDPQRFTRGVPVRGPDPLAPVMVRRLKSDLMACTDSRCRREIVSLCFGDLGGADAGWLPRRCTASRADSPSCTH